METKQAVEKNIKEVQYKPVNMNINLVSRNITCKFREELHQEIIKQFKTLEITGNSDFREQNMNEDLMK